MAHQSDPPVYDHWDYYDFDGDPGCCLDKNADFVDGGTRPSFDDDGAGHFFAPACATPIRQQTSSSALGQPHCLTSIPSMEAEPPQGWDPSCDMQSIVSIHGVHVASVPDSELATMEPFIPDRLASRLGASPKSLSDFTIVHLGTAKTCLNFPTLLRSGGTDGIMKTSAVGQGPEYVVKLLDRPSTPDRACPQDFTQPTPFVNHLAQQIAESTTIYYNDHFNQQPSTSDTELIDLSVATFNVGRHANDSNTNHTEFNPLLSIMAATTTGWPYGAQPVFAAPDAMEDNMFQHSPLSELYDMPDETDDWAVLMQQDMLIAGAFEMADFDYSAMETSYHTTALPQDIFNDPAVRYDIEQSLQISDAFNFNAPLPDLSTSGYLSGTDQVSSYFGSANTSPYEPALDFFPEAGLSPSSVFPASADGSPLDTNTTSPGSDTTSAAAHPYQCTTDGCTKTFRKEAQLKQHQRVHRKALVCEICRAERRTEHKFAQVRDLERHLQARHRDVAEKANVRSEIRQCPHPGCEHEGRRDNVSRHHKSKHGKELKWKRGVPHVVG